LLVGCSLLMSYYLYRCRGWDLTSSLLAVAPAGLTPLTAIAVEMNADVSKVTIMQLVQVVLVVLLAPVQGILLLP